MDKIKETTTMDKQKSNVKNLMKKETIFDKVIKNIPIIGKFAKDSPVSPTVLAVGGLGVMWLLSGLWSMAVTAGVGYLFVQLMTSGYKSQYKQIGTGLLALLWVLFA
jgi:hypothetical protein